MTNTRRASALLVGLAATLLLATAASATTTVTADRIFGETRYSTSQAIATRTFASAPQVILASGANFPDALAGAYAAGGAHIPVLLTPQGSLAPEALSAMQTLGTTGVLIVGGPIAISAGVESDLQSRGFTTTRIQGETRYDTARLIAESLPEHGIATTQFGAEGRRTAIVATGQNFPDALAAGALSYASALPILLTTTDSLSPAASQGLDNLAIKHVIILGGPAAVSPATESQISAKGISVRRLFGQNRTETAIAIADYATSALGFTTGHANLARGDVFADALSGSPHAGEEKAVVVLTANAFTLSSATMGWLQANSGTLNSLHVFGGPSAVNDNVIDEALRAAGRA